MQCSLVFECRGYTGDAAAREYKQMSAMWMMGVRLFGTDRASTAKPAQIPVKSSPRPSAISHVFCWITDGEGLSSKTFSLEVGLIADLLRCVLTISN